MSQQEQSKNSNDNESKTIENMPLSLHNMNNLLNTSDLKNSKKDNNVLNNNFVEVKSFSNNNIQENNAKITNKIVFLFKYPQSPKINQKNNNKIFKLVI